MSATTTHQEFAENMRRQFGGPMSEEEIRFLRNIQGFVEFAIRNGLSFPVVTSMISHDVNEVARDLFDIQKAKERGFIPKTQGFSDVTTESFGDEPVE